MPADAAHKIREATDKQRTKPNRIRTDNAIEKSKMLQQLAFVRLRLELMEEKIH